MIDFIDDKFIASLNMNDKNYLNTNTKETFQKEELRRLYGDWLYNEANRIFAEKARYYSEILMVQPEGIYIKNLKNRWG